jgi:hypothetical protein
VATRFIAKGGEHAAHAIDFHLLVRHDVRGERVNIRVLRGARRGKQLLHHRDRAAVVLDHAFEEELVEGRALEAREVFHLRRRQHAGHHRAVIHTGHDHAGHVHRVRVRRVLAVRLEPALHHPDLVGLRHLNPQAELLHVVAVRPRLQQLGHVDRLRVVMNHALHERHVRRCGADFREIARLLGADDLAGFAGGARLHDGRRRAGPGPRPAGCAGGGQAQQRGETAGEECQDSQRIQPF